MLFNTPLDQQVTNHKTSCTGKLGQLGHYCRLDHMEHTITNMTLTLLTQFQTLADKVALIMGP